MGNNNCTKICFQKLTVEFTELTNKPITKPIVKLQTLVRRYLTRKKFNAVLFDMHRQNWDIIFKKVNTNLTQWTESYIQNSLKYFILNFYQMVFSLNLEQRKHILNEANYDFTKPDSFVNNFRPLILLFLNKFYYLGKVRKALKDVNVEYEMDDNLFDKVDLDGFTLEEDKSKFTEDNTNMTAESHQLSSFSKKRTGENNNGSLLLNGNNSARVNTSYVNKNATGHLPIQRNELKRKTAGVVGSSTYFKENFFNKKIILVSEKANKDDDYNPTFPSNKSTLNSENDYEGRVKLIDSMGALYFEKILEEMTKNTHIIKTTFDRENGIFYQGGWDFMLKCKSGFGVQYSVNWVNGIRYKYMGYFKDNRFHGYGVMVREDGIIYQGEYREGKQSGIGVHIYNDKVYQGFFWDGIYHGYGELYTNHILKFKGCFNMGVKQDIGFTTNDDGTKYIGNYTNGKINDFGAFLWNEGHIYYGQWKNEKMDGRGKFKWFNGDLFVGYYTRDLKSGEGEYYFAEQNSVLKGIWQMGRKHGKFSLYKGGEKFMLIYKYDQQIS
jgi:hypothetical protein